MRGPVDPADQVEDRSLPGSVGSDQSRQFPSLESKVEIGNGLEPSEKVGEPADLKKRHGFPPWPRISASGAEKHPLAPAGPAGPRSGTSSEGTESRARPPT